MEILLNVLWGHFMLQVFELCRNPIRARSAIISHWQFSLTECFTSPLIRRNICDGGKALCTKERQPCVHIPPCLTAWRGWVLKLGTSKAYHVPCRWLRTCFAGELGNDQEWALSQKSLCILLAKPAWRRPSNLSVELAAHFLWCRERTNLQLSLRNWFAG